MDPKTGIIYEEDEIQDLDPEVQKRLIRGELEELQQLSELLTNVEKKNNDTTSNWHNEPVDIPEPLEKFYPVNRAARRKAEKRDRATRKRDPRG